MCAKTESGRVLIYDPVTKPLTNNKQLLCGQWFYAIISWQVVEFSVSSVPSEGFLSDPRSSLRAVTHHGRINGSSFLSFRISDGDHGLQSENSQIIQNQLSDTDSWLSRRRRLLIPKPAQEHEGCLLAAQFKMDPFRGFGDPG